MAKDLQDWWENESLINKMFVKPLVGFGQLAGEGIPQEQFGRTSEENIRKVADFASLAPVGAAASVPAADELGVFLGPKLQKLYGFPTPPSGSLQDEMLNKTLDLNQYWDRPRSGAPYFSGPFDSQLEIPDVGLHAAVSQDPQRIAAARIGLGPHVTAADIIHPSLPDLQQHLNFDAIFNPNMPANILGGFAAGDKSHLTGDIFPGLMELPTDYSPPVLAHELQHAIQAFEAHPPGASIEDPRLVKLPEVYNTARQIMNESSFEMPISAESAAQQALHDVYQRTWGEVEARNAENRMMKPRLYSEHPFNTLDVDPSEIVWNYPGVAKKFRSGGGW